MRRTERLYALVEHLRARRTATTVAALARRFAVTERTLFRDLAALREGGVPLDAEGGPGGGVRLSPDYALPPIGLSVEEAASLWLSLRLGQLLAPVPAGGRVDAALDKVLGALPVARRRALQEVVRRIVVGVPPSDAVRGGLGPVDADVFRTCEAALVRGHAVHLTYVDRHGAPSARAVEPHGLLVQAPAWYLLAVDLAKGAPRMFRLDRIRRAAPRPAECFTPRDPRELFAELQALHLELPDARSTG